MLVRLLPSRSRYGPLKEFGDTLNEYFKTDLSKEPTATVERTRTDKGEGFKETIGFASPVPVRYIVLQEDIRNGQHVEAADILITTASGRQFTRSVTTIGHKRIVPAEAPDVIEVVIEVKDTRATPHWSAAVY